MSVPSVSVPSVLYAHQPKFPLRAATLALVFALAGCVTSRPLVEQRTPFELPGAGTYAWDGAGPDASRFHGSATPDIVANAAPEIRSAIERAMSRRGYRQAPPDKAVWRLGYQTTIEIKSEDLAPDDRLLVPRMVCNLHECFIQQQWQHFGPPLYGEAIRNFRQATVRVTLHDSRNGKLVWQGSFTRELNDDGLLHRAELHNATNRLLGRLPKVPKDNPWNEVAGATGKEGR